MNLPVCAITLGGNQSAWDEKISGLVVECGLAPFVDHARITLATTDAPALDDSGEVTLGYENATPSTVFTGAIESIAHNLDGTLSISAAGSAHALARVRINQSYEKQKAGDIIKDLAARVSATTDNVQDGADLPFYSLDDTRSAWTHIAAIARLCGFSAYCTPQGGLNFEELDFSAPAASFRYGEDILAMRFNDSAPITQAVQVVGQGASGSQGADAWCWLTKEPATVSATAGEGQARLFSIPALRAKADIQTVAAGLSAAATRNSKKGRISVPGAPQVTLGATIAINNLPQPGLDGQALVHHVRHVFSKHGGFITEIGFTM